MNLATSLKATFSYFFVFLWFFFAGNVWAAKEAEIMKAADKNLQNYFYKEAMKQYKQLSQVASTEYMFMHGEIGQIKVSLAQGEFKQAEQISKQIPALFRKQLPNYKQLSIEAKMQIKLWEGRSLLLQKNTKEAYNTLSYVMQQGAGEVRLEAQFYAAKCLMLSRQWGNAATLLSEVQRKTDNRNLEFEAYCAQIELLINRESWPAVNRAFSQYFSSKLQNSKNDQVIHLLQITMLTYQNKFEEAISTYDRYLKNDMKTFRRIDHFVMLLEFASNMTSNNHEMFARRVWYDDSIYYTLKPKEIAVT